MDISKYRTLDNVVFYIYTVLDNFSRKILAWDISTKKCSKIRTETVKQAIKNEFDVDLKDQNLELIVDGGSENNNKTIAEFIKKLSHQYQQEDRFKRCHFFQFNSRRTLQDYEILLLPFKRNSFHYYLSGSKVLY